MKNLLCFLTGHWFWDKLVLTESLPPVWGNYKQRLEHFEKLLNKKCRVCGIIFNPLNKKIEEVKEETNQ